MKLEMKLLSLILLISALSGCVGQAPASYHTKTPTTSIPPATLVTIPPTHLPSSTNPPLTTPPTSLPATGLPATLPFSTTPPTTSSSPSISRPPPGCQYLWWFDDTRPYCQYNQFCGAYMWLGLRTFSTKAECEQALLESTPTPTPTFPPKGVVNESQNMNNFFEMS